MTLYFVSPATQNVEEAQEIVDSWSPNVPPPVTAASMFVPEDHVPEL
jgi:hypothetical protein